MTKTKRIEILEQRVAELIGEVEKLKGEVMSLSAPRPVWPSYEPGEKSQYFQNWTTPNTIWPYEITSGSVVIRNSLTNNKSYGNTSHG